MTPPQPMTQAEYDRQAEDREEQRRRRNIRPPVDDRGEYTPEYDVTKTAEE